MNDKYKSTSELLTRFRTEQSKERYLFYYDTDNYNDPTIMDILNRWVYSDVNLDEFCKILNGYARENEKLVNEINALYSALYKQLEKVDTDNVASQIEFLTGQNLMGYCDLYKANQEVERLRIKNKELQNLCEDLEVKNCELFDELKNKTNS